ncbi:MAG: hypothetical protein AAFR61_16415 [Bacteroidota bacterium]
MSTSYRKYSLFFILHLLLLMIVLLGFAPSFFLRPFGESPALSGDFILHGIACTAWFVAVCGQAVFIRNKKLVQHRLWGRYFSLLAPLITGSGLWIMRHKIQRFQGSGDGLPMEGPESPAFQSMIIWGEILILLSFLALVYLAYRDRNRRLWHQRWILLASVLIVQQALVRVGKMTAGLLDLDPGQAGSLFSVLGPLLIFTILTIHDRRRLGKVHRATQLCWTWYIGLLVVTVVLARTGLGVLLLGG